MHRVRRMMDWLQEHNPTGKLQPFRVRIPLVEGTTMEVRAREDGLPQLEVTAVSLTLDDESLGCSKGNPVFVQNEGAGLWYWWETNPFTFHPPSEGSVWDVLPWLIEELALYHETYVYDDPARAPLPDAEACRHLLAARDHLLKALTCFRQTDAFREDDPRQDPFVPDPPELTGGD